LIEKLLKNLAATAKIQFGDAVLASSMIPYIKSHYAHAFALRALPTSYCPVVPSVPFDWYVIGFWINKIHRPMSPINHEILKEMKNILLISLCFAAVYSRVTSMDCLATDIGASYTVWFKTSRIITIITFISLSW